MPVSSSDEFAIGDGSGEMDSNSRTGKCRRKFITAEEHHAFLETLL